MWSIVTIVCMCLVFNNAKVLSKSVSHFFPPVKIWGKLMAVRLENPSNTQVCTCKALHLLSLPVSLHGQVTLTSSIWFKVMQLKSFISLIRLHNISVVTTQLTLYKMCSLKRWQFGGCSYPTLICKQQKCL